jgi:hypothetical protein
MRVIIYSGYNNGLGDLNFGKKLAAEVHAKYPDATIELVTSPTKKLQSKKTGTIVPLQPERLLRQFS